MLVRFTSFVEIALGADLTGTPSTWSWTDITSYVHHPAGIAITRGRGDWYSQTPPARCNLTLINNDGRFVPRNPVGAYFGNLRRNTPLRVLIRPNTNSLSDAFNRTSSSSWGSADSGGAWTNTGGAASDFSVSPTNGGRHTHTSATSPHYSTLSISVVRYDVRVRVKTAALATGAALTAGIAVRYVDSSNTHRYEIQFNTDQSVTGRLVDRSSGADAVFASEVISGVTHAAGAWYWIRAQSGYTAARLKIWQDGTTEPSTWNIDGSDGLLPGVIDGAIGLYSMRETSNSNANATLDFDDFTMVDGPRIQYTGYVDEWPVRWADQSLNLSLAPITCSGLLRRIQQGQTLRSALFRANTDGYYGSGSAIAYWPCEDSSHATSIASGIGGPAMQIGGETTFASDSSIAGSDPLPVVSDTTSWVGVVPTYASATSWAIRWVMKIPSAPASTQSLLRWTTAGSLYIWQLNLVPGGGLDTIRLEAYNTALVEQLGDAGVSFADASNTELYDRQLYFEANGTQNGAAIDWDYNVWYGTNGIGATGSEASSTIGNVQSVRFGAGNGAAGLSGATIGHIAVSTDVLFGPGSDGATGFSGEGTDARLLRLAGEENLPSLFGELPSISVLATQTMGPQPTASLISQLREVEATEQGILHDGKQGHLTILPRSRRYNRIPELSLSVDSAEVNWPFEPTDDDQSLRNDVTVSRVGGSSARATDADSVATLGVYSDSASVNTETDAELQVHADWRLHLGTVDDLRYPQIPLNFTRTPDLIEAWLDADIGSRVQVAGPPSELPPDDIDVQIEGYTEVFDNWTWTATLNTSPAAPWQVFTLEDDDLGRLDTAGSSLVAAAIAGATSLTVATSSGPAWSTTAEPYHWWIAGEKITVTAMATATPAFIAAGTVAHGNNASVSPGLPAGMTADVGQVIIGMAAIRNSGTGVPDVPTGYTSLALSGNLLIFGKYYVSGDSAPTVSFTGGVANADTSARLFGFSGLSLELDDAESLYPSPSAQLNSSAANIAFPSLVIARGNCVALLFAWKQDDWTSVATPSSMDAEMADNATTTGDDQGIAAYYDIQTTATSIVAGSLSVTGGAAAISRAIVLALRPLQTATVTRAVNGVSKAQVAGADVVLWRPGQGGLSL